MTGPRVWTCCQCGREGAWSGNGKKGKKYEGWRWFYHLVWCSTACEDAWADEGDR